MAKGCCSIGISRHRHCEIKRHASASSQRNHPPLLTFESPQIREAAAGFQSGAVAVGFSLSVLPQREPRQVGDVESQGDGFRFLVVRQHRECSAVFIADRFNKVALFRVTVGRSEIFHKSR